MLLLCQSEGAERSFIIPGCAALVGIRGEDYVCCVVVVVVEHYFFLRISIVGTPGARPPRRA
eukprot:382629-Pyramimonas_sp.AAC.1